MPRLDRSATVAQIVVEHAVTARVFQKHQIDFCCHGNVSVPEACQARQLDPEALYAELEAAIPGGGTDGEDPRTLSTTVLIARIIDRHHGYLRRALPFVAPLAAKVARVHGEHNPKLAALGHTFEELAGALVPHLDAEEAVLFPALMARTPDPTIVRKELAAMYEDHLAVGKLLGRIRELSDQFTTPEWGCNSYRVYMAELAALEEDVLRHVHLENHVLMPRFSAEEPSRGPPSPRARPDGAAGPLPLR
jgi:regulator of cell morphogenesis and NO signaling